MSVASESPFSRMADDLVVSASFAGHGRIRPVKSKRGLYWSGSFDGRKIAFALRIGRNGSWFVTNIGDHVMHSLNFRRNSGFIAGVLVKASNPALSAWMWIDSQHLTEPRIAWDDERVVMLGATDAPIDFGMVVK